MDKIVYLYGSARDASTRAIRRTNFPREMQIRIGQWVIRPSRRTAVDFARLAPYAAELLSKVQSGVIQVQRADTSLLSAEELIAGFRELGAGPDYDTMPLAELHTLMRVENPEPAAKEAFTRRTQAKPAPVAAPAAVVPPPPPPPPEEPSEPEPEVPAVLEERPHRETDPAPSEPSRESQLPDGWRMLTNRELTSMCSDLGIPMPENITKKNIIAAVESWLGGS